MKKIITLISLSTLLSSCVEIEKKTYAYCERCQEELNPFGEQQEIEVINIKGNYVQYIMNKDTLSETKKSLSYNIYNEDGVSLICESEMAVFRWILYLWLCVVVLVIFLFIFNKPIHI